MLFWINRVSLSSNGITREKYSNGAWQDTTGPDRLESPTESAFLKTFQVQEDRYIECWTIKIDSIEDLMGLIGKEGEVIVQNNNYGIPEISIFDDYL